MDEELEKSLVEILKSYFEQLKNATAKKQTLTEEDDYEQVLSANRK